MVGRRRPAVQRAVHQHPDRGRRRATAGHAPGGGPPAVAARRDSHPRAPGDPRRRGRGLLPPRRRRSRGRGPGGMAELAGAAARAAARSPSSWPRQFHHRATAPSTASSTRRSSPASSNAATPRTSCSSAISTRSTSANRPTGSPPRPVRSSAPTRPADRRARPPPWPARSVRPDRLDPRTDPDAVARRRDASAGQHGRRGLAHGPAELDGGPGRAAPAGSAPAPGGAALAPHFVELVEAGGEDARGARRRRRDPPPALGHRRLPGGNHARSRRSSTPPSSAVRGPARSPEDPAGGHGHGRAGQRRHPQPLRRARLRSTQFDVASLGARQPGSAFKPFVYLAALREGIDPRTHLQRARRAGRSSATATSRSTTPATAAPEAASTSTGPWSSPSTSCSSTSAAKSGVEPVLRARPTPASPRRRPRRRGRCSSVGSTAGVSALTMAAAYATFAAGGVYAEPYAIARIVDADGKSSTSASPSSGAPSGARRSGCSTGTLSKVVPRGRAGRRPSDGRWRARRARRRTTATPGSSATSPQLSTAVWVGYEPRRPM